MTAAAERSGAELQRYLYEKIDERRSRPGRDLLSMLITSEVDGGHIPDNEIVAFCGLLLTAGGETAGKALANIIRHLVDHPDQMAAVRADRTLVDNAIAEALRYTPPNVILQREPLEDVVMSTGDAVPKDATIMCLVGAANRDDRHFADPERFDIHRSDLSVRQAFAAGADHVAFGAGRHFCVGAQLARAQLAIATNLLLDTMLDIRPRDGWEAHETGIVTRGLDSLELTFTPA